MPFSILLQGYPTHDIPSAHVQGPAIQGMFLHLMREVDPVVNQRLHDDSRYRPYTLSPLSVAERPPRKTHTFHGFQLPRQRLLRQGTRCAVRVTLLEDRLFSTFSDFFLARVTPTFRLGRTEFVVTSVLATEEPGNPWSRYVSYADLMARAQSGQRRITLQFLTPASFRTGDIDLPLPLPRLVFQHYLKRFREFQECPFLPDLVEAIERYSGIARMEQMRTDTIRTKNVPLAGFTGTVSFEISKKAPSDLVAQMNLLADFALFCGTGRKTTVGMGQTMRIA